MTYATSDAGSEAVDRLLCQMKAFVSGVAGSTCTPGAGTGAGGAGAGAGAGTGTGTGAAESDAVSPRTVPLWLRTSIHMVLRCPLLARQYLLEARSVMPTVWRVAFRSASAESAIVNVILNVRDEHMTAVLLCEDVDSNLREAFKAEVARPSKIKISPRH